MTTAKVKVARVSKPRTVAEILTLTNVRVGQPRGHQKMTPTPTDIRPLFSELVWEVATRNPLWVFTLETQYNGYATRADVSMRGEVLGQIGTQTSYQADKLYVDCERLKKARTMYRATQTRDLGKALTLVRKHFAPNSTAERMAAATEMVSSTVTNVYREHRNIFNQAGTELNREIALWGKNVMMEHFKGYAETNPVAHKALVAHEKAAMEMATVQGVADSHRAGHAMTIVSVGDEYIAKYLDKVQLYTHNTLPECVRGKLGMLKLVEDKQMVTGIGCRVEGTVFVVTLTPDEVTNVSVTMGA